MAEICGYKLRIQIFNGSENEDYDFWWENLCAFFDLYPFSEEDKVRLFNAHLGGEERRRKDETILNSFTNRCNQSGIC